MTGGCDALARAIDDVVAPAAREVDKRARFPRAGLAALAGAGALGCTVPRALGGGGRTLREAADIVSRVAASCASTGTVLQAHLTAVAVLVEHGPARLLREVAGGAHLLGCVMNPLGTLPGEAIGRGHVVDLYGQAPWVVAAGEADSLVWSVAERLYLVPSTAPGLFVAERAELIGLRGTSATALLADPVTVPRDNLLTTRATETVHDVAFPWFTVLGAAVSLGIMDSAITATARAVKGAGPAPAVLSELARMTVLADSVRGMFIEAAYAERGGARDRQRLLALRAAATRTAVGVTDSAMKVCQSAAPRGMAEVERQFRDARAAYAVPPTPDTALEQLGSDLYGD
ncbi:acyl-CoA dehydrogenase [Saccharomonospora marina XMU15]|uniref:Acyl-CoA dehydrogenase n=1 Tax=Saccharomonospora marina XMU15 TaxID=882083 RepID=H5X0V3_9PSEU|nr:acyl-CoA dehydrogenase family protein [Saccharomonospora marina]EHR51953.1 acyl-CoA dehydrogenase [Saccharomonospora marina XMU15]